MKKILIVSYFFAPKNEIGAVRLSKFTTYLVRLGWEVDVVTFKANPFLKLESTIDTTLECKEFDRVKIHYLEFPMGRVYSWLLNIKSEAFILSITKSKNNCLYK